MALSRVYHASFSQIMAKAIFPFLFTPFWEGKRKRGEVFYGTFCLYMIGLSEVAKNCSISANSYRSLEEPV